MNPFISLGILVLYFIVYEVNDSYNRRTVEGWVISLLFIHRHNLRTNKYSIQSILATRQCPHVLRYPYYAAEPGCYCKQPWRMILRLTNRIVWPVRVLSSLTAPVLPPIRDNGIVFYVYSYDSCRGGNNYMDQVERNAYSIIEKDPNVVECDAN